MSKAELKRKYKKIKALYESQIEILDEYRSEIRKLKQEREKLEKELELKIDIIKAIYKETPIAYRQTVRTMPKTHERYHCKTSLGEVIFNVPLSESNVFLRREDAKLLIRWIV